MAKTNDTTITPVLLGYNLQGILRPPRRKIIACTVVSARGSLTAQGTIDWGADIIGTTIEAARDATWPVAIKPFDYASGDSTVYVNFLPLPSNIPFWEPVKAETPAGGTIVEIEKHYHLLLQIVTLS